jgi:hypothetical protein
VGVGNGVAVGRVGVVVGVELLVVVPEDVPQPARKHKLRITNTGTTCGFIRSLHFFLSCWEDYRNKEELLDARPGLETIPAIILSADAEQHAAEIAARKLIGLSKPVDVEVPLQTIETGLAHSYSPDEPRQALPSLDAPLLQTTGETFHFLDTRIKQKAAGKD